MSFASLAQAQPGTVKDHQKISDTVGGFTGVLNDQDFFGRSIASLGDLDGDGIGDLAVGAPEEGVGTGNGSVWILFRGSNATERDLPLPVGDPSRQLRADDAVGQVIRAGVAPLSVTGIKVRDKKLVHGFLPPGLPACWVNLVG